MKIIGVTGGIGAGKSTVCGIFRLLGAPVFNADEVAKALYDTEKELVNLLRSEFGDKVFAGEKIDRLALAQVVFNDDVKLQALNRMIHPLVADKFKSWMHAQNFPYVIREAAILVESGSYKDCDQVLLITSSPAIKVKRVMARNNWNEEQVLSRIYSQMSDEDLRPFCDFEIVNNNEQLIIPSILELHRKFMA